MKRSSSTWARANQDPGLKKLDLAPGVIRLNLPEVRLPLIRLGGLKPCHLLNKKLDLVRQKVLGPIHKARVKHKLESSRSQLEARAKI